MEHMCVCVLFVSLQAPCRLFILSGSPVVQVEVRGMPNGIFHPWVRWDSRVEVAGKFFRRRRRRPPQKWVFGEYRFPSFSDT